MAEPILLKKYANRRLYDTRKSAYITLSEVADLVHQGCQVLVRDAKTNEDVTAYILTQIILEQARHRKVLLPAPVLHLIIRYGDGILSDFFENYFQMSMEKYIALKSTFDDQMKKWVDMGMDISGASNFSVDDFPMLKAFYQFIAPLAEGKNDRNDKS